MHHCRARDSSLRPESAANAPIRRLAAVSGIRVKQLFVRANQPAEKLLAQPLHTHCNEPRPVACPECIFGVDRKAPTDFGPTTVHQAAGDDWLYLPTTRQLRTAHVCTHGTS
jgi:hypothetical protein